MIEEKLEQVNLEIKKLESQKQQLLEQQKKQKYAEGKRKYYQKLFHSIIPEGLSGRTEDDVNSFFEGIERLYSRQNYESDKSWELQIIKDYIDEFIKTSKEEYKERQKEEQQFINALEQLKTKLKKENLK